MGLKSERKFFRAKKLKIYQGHANLCYDEKLGHTVLQTLEVYKEYKHIPWNVLCLYQQQDGPGKQRRMFQIAPLAHLH